MYTRLTITFTAAERTALERLAQQDTRPLKDQVRALVRAEAERRHVWPDDPDGPRQVALPAGSRAPGRPPAAAGIEPGDRWLRGRSADEPIP